MTDRNTILSGGPYDGLQIDWPGGTHLVFPQIHAPKRAPSDHDYMVVDEYGFHHWLDPDCNPTISEIRYTPQLSRGVVGGPLVAVYVEVERD